MSNEEITVDGILNESVQDDAAQAQGESLSAILETADTAEEPDQGEAPPAKEPGWINGRINKAVQKAVAETEARITKQYEEMLAPIRESVLERQAQELVDSGEFKSLERAKEYISLKNGTPIQTKEEPERDASGRFTKRTEDPVLSARADLLAKQAQKIKANRGIDVMAAFNQDPETKNKILSGEWDFYDVAEALAEEGHRPSSPVRSANRGSMGDVSISGMTEAQFKRLQENLSNGRRYDMRK